MAERRCRILPGSGCVAERAKARPTVDSVPITVRYLRLRTRSRTEFDFPSVPRAPESRYRWNVCDAVVRNGIERTLFLQFLRYAFASSKSLHHSAWLVLFPCLAMYFSFP